MAVDLESHLATLGLEKHRETLTKIARPSIELRVSPASIAPGCSKLGGSPDLPQTFVWPRHESGDYRFIGQINLSDVPERIGELPTIGLLSFFYAHNEDELLSWTPGFVQVFHFAVTEDLRSVTPPESVRLGASCRIALEPGVDVPPWPWNSVEREKWPLDGALEDAYWELRCRLHPSDRYLFGYPFNTTLAYDPTPGPDWTSLLTLASNDELDWCWGDGDWLVTFIERSRLRDGDFSDIKAEAG